MFDVKRKNTKSETKSFHCFFLKDMCKVLKKVQKRMKRNIITTLHVTYSLIAQRVHNNAPKMTPHLDLHLEFGRIFFCVKNACPTFAKIAYLYLSQKSLMYHLLDISQTTHKSYLSVCLQEKWHKCPTSRSTPLPDTFCNPSHLQQLASSSNTSSTASKSWPSVCLKQEGTPISVFATHSFLNGSESHCIRYLKILSTCGVPTTFSSSSLELLRPSSPPVSNFSYLAICNPTLDKTLRSHGQCLLENVPLPACLEDRSHSVQHYLLILRMALNNKTYIKYTLPRWTKREIKLNKNAMSHL